MVQNKHSVRNILGKLHNLKMVGSVHNARNIRKIIQNVENVFENVNNAKIKRKNKHNIKNTVQNVHNDKNIRKNIHNVKNRLKGSFKFFCPGFLSIMRFFISAIVHKKFII